MDIGNLIRGITKKRIGTLEAPAFLTAFKEIARDKQSYDVKTFWNPKKKG